MANESDITLSPDQYTCYCSILDWINSSKSKVVTKFQNILTVGGYAGTGKTTLIGKVRRDLGKTYRIAFCAYTGKAASVLNKKLIDQNAVFEGDYCGTIHRLIYIPVVDKDTNEIIKWEKKSILDYDLIICDEASMVGETIFLDLTSFKIPILAVGDHGQLPPIESSINLMQAPDIRLEKIHRTAENSPIIKLSLMARNDGYIPFEKFSDTVLKVRPKDPAITKFIVDSGDFNSSALLCGFNKTRIQLN
jgi:exodeoxyribonuclease-5